MQIIPRKIIFSNPDKTSPKISPDSEHISFLKDVDGVMNIFIMKANSDIKTAKQITYEKKRSINQYFFSYDNQHILYLKDKDGDENFSLYSVNIETLETKHLTPFQDSRIFLYKADYKFPNKIIIGINNRDKKFHDPYELNIETGELKLILQNDSYIGFNFDESYNLVFGYQQKDDGSTEIYKFNNGQAQLITRVDFEDKAQVVGFSDDSSQIYWIDNRSRDKTALIIEDATTGEKNVIATDPNSDISNIIVEPKTNKIQAYCAEYLKPENFFLDEKFKLEFQKLEKIDSGHIDIVSRSLDDKKWIISYRSDTIPAKFYLYDHNTNNAKFLFTTKPQLLDYKLQPTDPIVIKARDGLELVSYLTLPSFGQKPYPLVLNVHGGPRARDSWGLNMLHQWLANRGYAVLSVNYRGSNGFGKNFINAGNGEWAGKMHDDLIDSVNHLVEQGLIDPKKVAIEGGSYGGYAALVGMTFTPDFFCCGIDIVGPSNLLTLINSIPEYWKPVVSLFHKMIGNPNTEEGRKLLEERSPLSKVDNIKKPLLIQHGLHDPRVKVAESRQIVDSMQKKNIPVIYMEFSTEGHGFLMPQNRLAAYAVTEIFLSKYLGGKLEKIDQKEYDGAKFTIEAGLEYLPGFAINK